MLRSSTEVWSAAGLGDSGIASHPGSQMLPESKKETCVHALLFRICRFLTTLNQLILEGAEVSEDDQLS